MPDIKNTFTGGKMNKDLDERLLPSGQYRDAMNIQVATSDLSEVGTVQNILGNIEGCTYEDPSYAVSGKRGAPSVTNPISRQPSRTVGSIADEKNDTLYWFVAGPGGSLVDAKSKVISAQGSDQELLFGDGLVDKDLIMRKTPYKCEPVFTDIYGILLDLPTQTTELNPIQTTHVNFPHNGKSGFAWISEGVMGIEPGMFATGIADDGRVSNTVMVEDIVVYDTISPEHTRVIFANPLNLIQSTPNTVLVEIEGAHCGCGGNHYDPTGRLLMSPNNAPSIGDGVVGLNIPSNTTVTDVTGVGTNQVQVTLSNIPVIPNWKTIGGDTAYPLISQVTFSTNPGNQNIQCKYIYFHRDRVLNFKYSEQITGVNIIDDLLLWTDNNSEPKKINIPRSIEGTDPSGFIHTKLVNDFVNPPIRPDFIKVPIKEEHITVIKKSPKTALSLDIKTAREPSKNYTGVMQVISTGSFLDSSFLDKNLSPHDSYRDFSRISVGDHIYIKMDESVNGNKEFELHSLNENGALWEEDTKVVLKEFDGDTPPTIPIANNYRIKGVVLDWEWNRPYAEDIIIGTGSLIRPARIGIKVTSIVGDPPVADPDIGFLKYAVDVFGDSEKVFEFKFPRFSYRYKYEDGEYSNFAPFTEPAFSPGGFDYHPKKGYNLGMTNRATSIILRDFITSDLPQDVVEIDLLYKDDGSPNVYIVNTIKPNDTPLTPGGLNPWYSTPVGSTIASGVYEVTSDTIYASVAANQLLRPWDNVPRKALAQEVTGNRVVYGNYVQNYDLKNIYPKFVHNIESDEKTLDRYGRDNIKSIKSLREYQLGVVFTDEYGRQTPVISNPSGTFKLDKTYGDDENRLSVKIKNTTIPNHFKYYKFFIKETSGEYYNIAMDRFYNAEDGNYWLAFPSVERNKIDLDTFLILKKSADSNEMIVEPARYRVLAIENEAPDYIKTSRLNIGEAAGVFGDTISNSPVRGTSFFELFSAEFDKGSAGKMHEVTDPLYVEFQDISTDEISNRYRITEMNKSNFDAGDNKFFVKLNKPLEEDVEFLLDDIDNPTKIKGTIKARFFKYVVENKPQFDGRFFVKVYADETFEQYIDLPQKQVEKEYRVTSEKKIYYMASDHVERHDGSVFGDGSNDPGQNAAVYGGLDPSNCPRYDNIIYQLRHPANENWIKREFSQGEDAYVQEVEYEEIDDWAEHGHYVETESTSDYLHEMSTTWQGQMVNIMQGMELPPGFDSSIHSFPGTLSGGWGGSIGAGHEIMFDDDYDLHTARHSALFHNLTPHIRPSGDHLGDDKYSKIKWQWGLHSESLFDPNQGDGAGVAGSGTGQLMGETDWHIHTGDWKVKGRPEFIHVINHPAQMSEGGWGMISNQGFPETPNQTLDRPGDWEDGWGHGHRPWDGQSKNNPQFSWLKRQGPKGDMLTDASGNYQTLFGEFEGVVTSAVGWYNIPSSYRDSGAEMLGEFHYDKYTDDYSVVVNKAGFVPIADKNNTRMNIDPFTTHEDNPDGTIKQDLYRFVPPTVDNWFYYSAYFASYKERYIFPKKFKHNKFYRGGSNNPDDIAGELTGSEDIEYFHPHVDEGHMYFDVLNTRGNADKEGEYEDVWYIDDCAYVGRNSYNQESWGKNYQGAKYTFHNYPRLNEDLTAKADPEGGITKIGSGSRLSLSFGGINPETSKTQKYWNHSGGGDPNGAFEQFHIDGADGMNDNFWDLTHPERLKYTGQVQFIKKLAAGRQFRWKQDPTGQIYTIDSQVNESNRLRYDSNPLNADGESTGGSYGNHHSYDKRFDENNIPNINAQWPLNIGNRIENFFKNYKIRITPEIGGWDPIQNGYLGPIEDGLKITHYSEDNGVTLTAITAATAAHPTNTPLVLDRVNISAQAFEAAWDSTMGKSTRIEAKRLILTEVGNGSGSYTVLDNPFLIKEIIPIGDTNNPSEYSIVFEGYDNNPENIGEIAVGNELKFQQPTMNGLSKNSAANITNNNSKDLLGMGAVGYHIQFVEPLEKDQILPDDPSVWETEPKESTDLDIYYEISGDNPVEINHHTIKTAIPVGSTIGGNKYEVIAHFGDEIHIPSIDQAFLEKAFSNPLTAPAGDASVIFPNDLIIIRPDGSSFEAKIDLIWFYGIEAQGTYVTAEDLLTNKRIKLGAGLYSTYDTFYKLNWFNCYSFGNGVESNRIRDSFNLPFISNGVKASTTLEARYEEEHRKYGLIYSGIYNSSSGVNNLNQFIQAEPITKDINPIYGSIQKLHSQSTAEGDLITLCEDRVLKILANKDALYNADGNVNLVATGNVLGQTIPFSGEYGISENPESFAAEAYRVYFADKVRGCILRLSKDGLTPISDNGMRGWFRDNLKLTTRIIGSHDDKKNEYNVTLKGHQYYNTVTYREDIKGWVSFKSFIPENGISMANDYYTFYKGDLYKHHEETVDRNTFYEKWPTNYIDGQWTGFTPSSINVILNASPGVVKSFHTLNYEGSQTKVDINTQDDLYSNLTAKKGWYAESLETDKEKGSLKDFIEKEGKWFGYIKGESIVTDEDNNLVINEDGSSTFDQASFAIQGIGTYNEWVYGPCDGPIGCIDPDATNYDPEAKCGSQDCVWSCDRCQNGVVITDNYYHPFTGCPLNWVLSGSVNPCEVLGCTDSNATNYNPNANVDDGSCMFRLWEGYNCVDGHCQGTDGKFTYNTLSDCQNNCTPTISCDTCQDGYPVSDIFNSATCPQGWVPTQFGVNPCNTTIICDTCDNGYPQSNVFTGNVCPQGWIPTSNMDPCNIPETWNCIFSKEIGGNICHDFGTGTGTYTSLQDCQAVCAITVADPCPVCKQLDPPYIAGCCDATAVNYNPLATCNDGSCAYSCPSCKQLDPPYIAGCCDYTATNYNPSATCDDGSCTYDPCPMCTPQDPIKYAGCCELTATNYDPSALCNDGSCVYDSCPACIPGNTDPNVIEGCCDDAASNYDPLATCDDGSCTVIVYGCMDDGNDPNFPGRPTGYIGEAFNYWAGANSDDGSCVYFPGCTDPTATNYDPLADVDDSSCTYDPCPTGVFSVNVISNADCPNCNNGSVNLDAHSITPVSPWYFLITDSVDMGMVWYTGQFTGVFNTSAGNTTVENFAPGDYMAHIIFENGCTGAQEPFTITIP